LTKTKLGTGLRIKPQGIKLERQASSSKGSFTSPILFLGKVPGTIFFTVVFWKWIEVKDPESETGKNCVPFLRYLKWFENLISGLSSRRSKVFNHSNILNISRIGNFA